MSVFVSCVYVFTLAWALISNRDTFSPAKLFLFSFLIFHLAAFSQKSDALWMLVLLVLLVGATTVMFEALVPLPREVHLAMKAPVTPDRRYVLLWIWGLSLPGIVGQTYVIYKFGGIQGYANVFGNRVIELRGLGWATTLASTLLAFNLAYFAVGLTRTRSIFWWLLYICHFLMVLTIGLLSGSRSGVLTIFAIQLFCFHYIKGRVRLAWAIPVAVLLLGFAMVLSVVRNGVKVENDTVTTGLAGRDQVVEFSTFEYGTRPLQILLDADHLKLAYGMTLVSLITNAVPRAWWPEKPESGGIYFTKVYTGDAWDGASNLSPTLLGEGIINFGWTAGILFFIFVYPAVMCFIVKYYRRTVMCLRLEPGPARAINLVQYVFVLWSAVALMTGEITNVTLGLILTRIVPLVVIKRVLGYHTQRARQRQYRQGLINRAAFSG